MFIGSIAAAILGILFLLFASSLFGKLFAFVLLAGAVYVGYRQFRPAPEALAEVEATVTDAAGKVVGVATGIERSIEDRVGRTPTTETPAAKDVSKDAPKA